MALSYDFDILRPSVPGTLGISVSLASGSGNTGLKAELKRRATSRVSSTCGTWSTPTGNDFALYMRVCGDSGCKEQSIEGDSVCIAILRYGRIVECDSDSCV